ncbi:MAG: hypothetical protein JW838_08185 [Spirochaetes bacterium]|nr:hypothetical protein [Spirochaetota bacterium]
MKFRKNEKVFIIAGLVLVFLFGILLFIDVSKKSGILADGRERIGTILYLNNHVRRIPERTETEYLGQGSTVLNNDTLVTARNSSAGIAIRDGTLVDMCGDSIMRFTRSGATIMIVLERGCADITRSGDATEKKNTLAVMAADRMIVLREGDLAIARHGKDAPELFVRRGEAWVFMNDEQRTIYPHERAVLNDDAPAVEKKILRLVDPTANRRFFTEGDRAEIEFVWDFGGEKEKKNLYLVEISRNRWFSPVFRRISSRDEMAAASLPEGEYYWRVSLPDPEASSRVTSETGRFAVTVDGTFALLSPADGGTVEYGNAPPLIPFLWEPHPLADSYLLEISEVRDFSNVVARIDSRVVNVSYRWKRALKPGEEVLLHWRVAARGSTQGWRGRRSGTGRFVVRRIEALTPPRLVYPADGEKMSRSRVEKEHVIFSWEQTEDTVKKMIIFSRDGGFQSLYREVGVDRDHWTMNRSFPPGTYHWRVALIDNKGKRKTLSNARRFSLRDFEDLALLSPRNGVDVTATDIEQRGLRFRWKKPVDEGNYILEMSGDRDFTKIRKSIATESPEATVRKSMSGDLFWRVRSLNRDGTVAAESETRTLTVREDVTPPVVIYPRVGGAVKMLTENELTFSWKPSNWANAYDLELHQLVKENGSRRDRLLLSTRTDEERYTVSDLNLLDVGEFYWTLRAVKKDRSNRVIRSSRKVRNDFNINLGDSKIIIVSPEIQVIRDEDGE